MLGAISSFAPVWQPMGAATRPGTQSENLALSPVPAGFRAVEEQDGSLRSAGPSLVKRRLEANHVRLIAIRHGQSQSNADSEQLGQPLLYGQSESPLTAKGIQQARDCAVELYRQLGGDDWLKSCVKKPENLPVFCSSTVSRAMDSSQILVDYLKERLRSVCGEEAFQRLSPLLLVVPERRLLESSFGRFERRPLGELQQAYPEFSNAWRPPQGMGTDFRHRFPGGESRADVMGRVTSFLDGLARACPGRTVVMMTHGEAVLSTRAVLGLLPEEEGKLRAQTGAVGNAIPYWLVGQSANQG